MTRRRAVGAALVTTAMAGTVLASYTLSCPASAGPTSTIRGHNGPRDCVAITGDGTVRAPQPGECAQYGKAGQGRTDAKARNVILIIGDGMGQQEITAARNYLRGAAGRFEGIDALTSEGLYTHHSINKDGSVAYVTDSAASGTAWATGTKTYNGAISVDLDGRPQRNLIEAAKAAGMRTGNVSTAEIQDATPAVLGAHAVNRKCYGPEMAKNSKACQGEAFAGQFRENGGWGSISEQIVETRADVTLGGGMRAFTQKVQEGGQRRNTFLDSHTPQTTWTAGKTVLDNARDNELPGRHHRRRAVQGAQGRPEEPGAGTVLPGQHDDGLPAVLRLHGRSPHGADHLPEAGHRHRARDRGDDPQGHRTARRPELGQGVLPAGRVGLHRQAGPRFRRLRPDR